MTGFSRRKALAAGGVLGAAALGTPLFGGLATAGTTRGVAGARAVPEEKKTLDQLYQDALKEGGNLVIYAGGDTPTQQDRTKQALLARFPELKVTMVVDYSKFHDVRLDNQIATDSVVPDVIQLQTLQNFPRWKKDKILLPYKPAGFSSVYKEFKDPDGAWLAVGVLAFSYMYNVAGAGGAAPASPRDLVDPRWKGQIASSYPNDDDAVLYLFKLYAQAYGWDWIAKLAAQELQFARGSHTPGAAVSAGQKVIGLGGTGTLTAPPTAPVRWVVAQGEPFMAWGQRAAILAAAKHPAAAKLYLNWQISTAVQQNAFNGWSVRTDVTPAGGLEPIWRYPNSHLAGFPAFMADRADVERWRQTFALYFGEVVGDPSPGRLGLHPGR